MDQYGLDFNLSRYSSCIPFCSSLSDTLWMDTWRDRARKRLKALGLTQEWLATEFDMTPAGIQKWLAGTRKPSLEEIDRIAEKLKTPRAWLIHGIGPNDTVDGLEPSRQQVLRRLIELERSGPLPETFWAAISAMAETVAPGDPGTQVKSHATSSRNGTDG